MSTASIPRSIKILFPPMDTFRRNTIGGLLGCLGIGIFLWTCMLQQPLDISNTNLIFILGLQGLFILGQSLEKHFCKCGQPIESLDYYIVIRHDTALLIPWGWDTNKELTSLPTVRLRSNATFTSVPSDPVEPFCCRPPSEQAETLCHLIESVLERDDIPCSIFQLEKDPLHSWVKFGTL
jgi:hypothetical protein